MQTPPFFSILTAAYNSRPTLRQTIDSIKTQCFQNLEHIVIDGGSSDNTVDLLKQYQSAYNLRWVSEPDNGISDALNKGLHQAKGMYVYVLQADDCLLDSTVLEKVYLQLNEERIDIMSFPVILDHPEHGRMIKKPNRFLWWNHFKFIFLHQGCFVNRHVFDEVGGFREEFQINMDYDFFYRALDNNCSVKFGSFPVALMGGQGVGSDMRFISKRLREEILVQKLNERSLFWRSAQLVFRSLYMPYKTRLLSAPRC